MANNGSLIHNGKKYLLKPSGTMRYVNAPFHYVTFWQPQGINAKHEPNKSVHACKGLNVVTFPSTKLSSAKGFKA